MIRKSFAFLSIFLLFFITFIIWITIFHLTEIRVGFIITFFIAYLLYFKYICPKYLNDKTIGQRLLRVYRKRK